MLDKLNKYAKGRYVLFLLVITLSVYLSMLLYFIPSVLEQAPTMKLLDMSPTGYSYAYAKKLLDSIGPEGRQAYLTRQLPMDFIYPGLFALTYSLMLIWLFFKRFERQAKIYWLALLPIIAGAFDYSENIAIILMLQYYPVINPDLVQVSSLLTIVKSSASMASFLLLLYGIGALLIRKKIHA